MSNPRVKELMIPAEEYCRVRKESTLQEAMLSLVKQGEENGLAHPHRDLLVEDADGNVVGKVTMLDIFRSMEPSYFKMDHLGHPSVLAKDYVQKVYADFNLWSEPLKTLCLKCAGMKVEELMHTPAKSEMVSEDDSIDKALHAFVLGLHQPILVHCDGRITGVLRLGDIFESVRKAILACEL
ncbi:CBS domain-containing protein [Maridesulfovibrio sp.]|uniref:CBS domain-containing protein n=1 Tax=Maridesulfovibrio sp. TaxID=2795000 RepID=UPI002A18C57D|nr:CBS domain-containing protein [Maridesulfovibrio sp.]